MEAGIQQKPGQNMNVRSFLFGKAAFASEKLHPNKDQATHTRLATAKAEKHSSAK